MEAKKKILDFWQQCLQHLEGGENYLVFYLLAMFSSFNANE
jgi:hypothetical protein